MKAYSIVGFFLVLAFVTSAQNQKVADSLTIIYENGSFKQDQELEILRQLAINEVDIDEKLIFSNKLIESAKLKNDNNFLIKGYLEKGNAFRLKSDLTSALESYIEGAKIAESADISFGEVYTSIGDVYSISGNHYNAILYYDQAIGIFKNENDSNGIATVLLNMGQDYFDNGELDTALMHTISAATIYRNIDYPLGQAYALGNEGMIYAELGEDQAAEQQMNLAISIMEELGEFYPIAIYLTYVSDIYSNKNDSKTALMYAHQSLDIAKSHGLKQEISDASLKLSELYEKYNQTNKSLAYYKDYTLYRDSVNNLDAVHKMADLRTDFEVSKKQIEVDLLNQEKKTQRIIRNGLMIFLGLISLLLIALYRFYKAADREKSRSDKLLLNILPVKTAEELKENGKVAARKFESVTVLFTDFVGFTKYSETLSPEELVEIIDFYFSKFDEIVEKYGLEKIKTIGDAYMCAGGLPFPTEGHANKMIHAALDIRNFVKKEQQKKGEPKMPFDIRIGINTGPVVAGVVGFKKFAYDIWGDTVNVASRLETNSKDGEINISDSTYRLIKDQFKCEYRGEIEVKHKGLMKMYFVKE